MAYTKEKRREYDHKYREEHREKIKEQRRKYREENKEKLKEQQCKYREEHREEINERGPIIIGITQPCFVINPGSIYFYKKSISLRHGC